MIKEEIIKFLDKEYGDNAEELLQHLMNKNEISNLEHCEKGKLRMLARDIRDSLPSLSITKRNLLFASIVKILRLDIIDTSSDKFKESEEIKTYPDENKKIQKFINNVERSLSKYETVFNLFWLRAGDAELEGISHEEILKTTQKALIGIKNELEKNKNEILMEYHLLEKNIEKSKLNFHFKSSNLIEQKINEKNDEEFKRKKIIKNIVDEFWKYIEDYYSTFKKIFLQSMEKDIILKKQGLDDSKLVEETKDKMIQLWGQLEQRYKKFSDEMKKEYNIND
jgi:hypothetical protein